MTTHPHTVASRVVTSLRMIVGALDRSAFTYATERQLHDGLAEAFADAGLHMSREVPLSPTDRIDFTVNRVGIEVKIKGGLVPVMQQLQRYAASPDLDALLLITTKAAHLDAPETIGGKPLHLYFLPMHVHTGSRV